MKWKARSVNNFREEGAPMPLPIRTSSSVYTGCRAIPPQLSFFVPLQIPTKFCVAYLTDEYLDSCDTCPCKRTVNLNESQRISSCSRSEKTHSPLPQLQMSQDQKLISPAKISQPRLLETDSSRLARKS